MWQAGSLSTLFVLLWRGLSCPRACGILVAWPGMEPTSSALKGRFLTTGPQGKSQSFFEIFLMFGIHSQISPYFVHPLFLDIGTPQSYAFSSLPVNSLAFPWPFHSHQAESNIFNCHMNVLLYLIFNILK